MLRQSDKHERANNHGRVAGASRLAASLYLGDSADLAESIAIFKGWLGDESSYDAFTWKNDLSWQADPTDPVGINPVGATRSGFSIDGALPEEMRRGCNFTVPPCPTTYPWGAFQAVFLVAEILEQQGYDAWGWEDQALLRAADFVHDLDVAYGDWWAKGDDIWQPWLINHAYGTGYPTEPVTRVGKTFAWSDWLWGSGSGGGGGDPTPPVANFSATPTSGAAPLEVSFTDTSTSGPNVWAWTFGDGGTSSERHPTYTYGAAGTYTVSLTSTNADGSDTESRTGYITVAEPTGNATPVCGPRSLTVAQDGAGDEVAPSCTDADGEPLTYTIAANGSKGVASVTASDQLSYLPNAGQSGSDSFTYTASDATATSAPATVSVTITPTGGGGTPVTVDPEADTYVRSSDPTVANGSATTLRTRSGSLQMNSYLRFTASGVGAASSATLRLYVSSSSPDAGKLYRVPDNTWSEALLYADQPALGTLITDLGAVTSGGYVEIDVSSYVTGDGTYSFALIGESNTAAQFRSRETVSSPELVLTP